MNIELFIALRYLFARKGGQKFISITSVISVLGVALGVAALIVVMGIMTGFTTDLRDKLISVTAQVVISNSFAPTDDTPKLYETLRNVPGVTAVTPFIYSELMLSNSRGVKGVMVRGIDPNTGPQVLAALNKLTAGSVAELGSKEGLPGIIVGAALASHLDLDIGSRVNLLSPTGQQSMTGFSPSIKPFRVVGIFRIGSGEYDTSVAYVSLDAARGLLGLPPTYISGVEMAVADIYDAENVGGRSVAALGPEFRYQTWMSMNGNLFAALKLEKTAMAIVLNLLIVVGCFSIVTSLVMLVMEKTKDIAILLSMGATPKNIRRIFMLQGSVIGAMGTVLGFILGLFTCFLITKYQFIKLPPGVYSLDYVPVLLQWPDLVATGVGGFLLSFLATIYPARQAASLEPVSALRGE